MNYEYLNLSHNNVIYHCQFRCHWDLEYIEIAQIIFEGANILPALLAIDNTLEVFYNAIDKATRFHEQAGNLYREKQLKAM